MAILKRLLNQGVVNVRLYFQLLDLRFHRSNSIAHCQLSFGTIRTPLELRSYSLLLRSNLMEYLSPMLRKNFPGFLEALVGKL